MSEDTDVQEAIRKKIREQLLDGQKVVVSVKYPSIGVCPHFCKLTDIYERDGEVVGGTVQVKDLLEYTVAEIILPTFLKQLRAPKDPRCAPPALIYSMTKDYVQNVQRGRD